MGFWQNVETEREYQGMSRKELASDAEITYASIGIGLERNSVPAADTALRIAKTLNVSIEYLVTGKNQKEDGKSPSSSETVRKYYKTIRELESMNDETRKSIIKMIENVAKK